MREISKTNKKLQFSFQGYPLNLYALATSTTVFSVLMQFESGLWLLLHLVPCQHLPRRCCLDDVSITQDSQFIFPYLFLIFPADLCCLMCISLQNSSSIALLGFLSAKSIMSRRSQVPEKGLKLFNDLRCCFRTFQPYHDPAAGVT